MTMQNNREIPYGRGVYFLCPPDAVRNDLVFEIIQHQYEVYIVDDPEATREMLAGTNAILLVNLDADAGNGSWQDYIIGLKAGEEHSRVGIGVLTAEPSAELRELYLMSIGVDCGVVTLKPEVDNVARVIIEVLRSNDAVGRRNAVRVNCAGDPNVECTLEGVDDTLSASLDNISALGVACTRIGPRPPKSNEYFSTIRLNLHGSQVVLSGRLLGEREVSGEPLHVVLFDRNVAPDERRKVHRFVHERLQEDVNRRLVDLQRQLQRRRTLRIVRAVVLSVLGLGAVGTILYLVF